MGKIIKYNILMISFITTCRRSKSDRSCKHGIIAFKIKLGLDKQNERDHHVFDRRSLYLGRGHLV